MRDHPQHRTPMTANIQPAQWRSTVPLYIHLGFELDVLDAGRSQVRLRFQPHLGNSRGEGKWASRP
jgi:hypothetical protein